MIQTLVATIISLYMYAVIIRVLLSWVNPDPSNVIVRYIYQLTDPPLLKIREYMPRNLPIDLSPWVLIIALQIIQRWIVSI